jgi:hypothetical protein
VLAYSKSIVEGGVVVKVAFSVEEAEINLRDFPLDPSVDVFVTLRKFLVGVVCVAPAFKLRWTILAFPSWFIGFTRENH